MATAVHPPPTSVELFYSYAHCDEPLCKELQKHLTALKRSGLIRDWYDRKIEPGSEWAAEIQLAMERAGVILLLVSADFLASKYIFEVELPFALQRHTEGRAKVIPILLRPVEWHDLPFAKLQVLPTSARPVTSWPNADEAFSDVAGRLRELLYAERLEAVKTPVPVATNQTSTQERVLDAAIASTVVVDEPTDLVTMFRTTDSGGLKSILQLDRTYSPTAEDVKSNTVEIDFPRDPTGKLLSTSVTLLLEAPGFDPPSEPKKVRIPASGDSSVFVFMLTPKRAGTLRPNLRILVDEIEIGSRLLLTKAVPAEAAQPLMSYNVISMPVLAAAPSDPAISAVFAQPPRTHGGDYAAPVFIPEAASDFQRMRQMPQAPAPTRAPPVPAPAARQPVPKPSKRNVWLAIGSSAAAIALVATLTTQFNSVGSRNASPSSGPAAVDSAPAPAGTPRRPAKPTQPEASPARAIGQSQAKLRLRLKSDQERIKGLGPHPASARAKGLIGSINSNLQHAETAASSRDLVQAQRYIRSAEMDLDELEAVFDLAPPPK